MLHRAISGEKGYVVAIERWADACRIGCEFFRIGGFFAGEDDERFHLKVFIRSHLQATAMAMALKSSGWQLEPDFRECLDARILILLIVASGDADPADQLPVFGIG